MALVEGRAALELADVGAGDERLVAGAGDHHHADPVVGLDLVEGREGLGAHLLVERVQLFGSIHGEDRNPTLPLLKNGLTHRGILL